MADDVTHAPVHAGAPIPDELRIGVTGHRELTHPRAVEDAVRALLRQVVTILEGNGQRTPPQLTVVTSLARGADQIVARVVGEMVQPERRDRYLEAVLPFEPGLYAKEFAEPDLGEFRRLLHLDRGRQKTQPRPTIICRDFPVMPDPADENHARARVEAFAEAGRFVVDTSEIVIAIWDPARKEQPGGTADTVRYALDTGRPVFWLNPGNLEAGAAVLRALDPHADPADASHLSRPDAPPGCRVEAVAERTRVRGGLQ